MSWVCVCLCAAVSLATADVFNSPSPITSANGQPALWNATWVDQLKHDLLMKYDKFSRPTQHTNVTEVSFLVVISHVEVDEVRSMMVINAMTNMKWRDEKLKWNASDYGGLTKLVVGDHEIWQPDIVLYNSALGNSIDHYGNTHCLVSPDGEVLWVPPSQFSAYCDINLRKWPYDKQTCRFTFGSWVYDGEQIVLKKLRNSSIETDVDMVSCVWSVVSVNFIEHVRMYACCSEPYYDIQLEVTVQRRSPAYTAVVFIPAFVCVVLTLAVFWLPPSASEKFLVSGIAAVIICMFLMYFAQRLPSMGAHTPLIVEFYSYNLILVCLSVVTSVVTTSLSRRPSPQPVPWFLSRLLHSSAISYLGISNTKGLLMSGYPKQDCEELHERGLVDRGRTESVDTTATQSAASHDREWVHLATALDRIMFLIYVIIFFLISSAFYLS